MKSQKKVSLVPVLGDRVGRMLGANEGDDGRNDGTQLGVLGNDVGLAEGITDGRDDGTLLGDVGLKVGVLHS